jgi:uncharacterized SAM-binding protein YcdF (DUF218 family)
MWVNGPGSMVIVDRESAAVCKRAAELAEEFPDARICITAGMSPKFGVLMNVVMAECLKRHHVHTDRIVLNRIAREFNTRGEMEAFAPSWKHLDAEADTQEIHVVDRNFHMRRSCLLLEAQLDCYLRRVTKIVKEPVVSQERLKNLFREPVALAKDLPYILRRRLVRWWSYYVGL